jgi:conjugal transfer mating pair stabilization protein TraN
MAGDGTCTRVADVCVQGPETRTISGQPVTRDCWQYQAS